MSEPKNVNYTDELQAQLKDRDYAIEYLIAALDEGRETFALALDDVIKANANKQD